MTQTVLDQADKTIRVQNYYEMFDQEQNLVETLLAFDDTADEITSSDAAMRVIFALDQEGQ
jgi:hypothetical protein